MKEWTALGIISALLLSLACLVWSVQGYPSYPPSGTVLCQTLAGQWGVQTDTGCEVRGTRRETVEWAWDRHWIDTTSISVRELGFRGRNNLAAVCLQLGDLDRAEALLVSLLAEQPGYNDAWANLGTIYHERARRVRGMAGKLLLMQAGECYQIALQLSPWHQVARDGMAQLQVDWGRM